MLIVFKILKYFHMGSRVHESHFFTVQVLWQLVSLGLSRGLNKHEWDKLNNYKRNLTLGKIIFIVSCCILPFLENKLAMFYKV